jgi:hypothetical protein
MRLAMQSLAQPEFRRFRAIGWNFGSETARPIPGPGCSFRHVRVPQRSVTA